MATQRATVVWIDANGATTATLLTTSAGASTVQADILAKSTTDALYVWEGALHVNGSPAPPGGTYQSVKDRAVLTFLTAAGGLLTLTIPGPLSSIFLADQETVDPTQLVTLIADVIANVVDVGGNAVVSYVSGIRETV